MAEYLRTQRLLLRNFRPGDLEELYDYRNDERCSRYQRGQLNRRPELVCLTDGRTRQAWGCWKSWDFAAVGMRKSWILWCTKSGR